MDGSSQVLSLFKRQGHEISTLHRAPLLVSRPNSSPLRSLEKKTWPRGKQSNKESTCQYHQYYGSVEIWKQKPIGLKLSVSADTQVHCSPATLNFLSCPTLPTPTKSTCCMWQFLPSTHLFICVQGLRCDSSSQLLKATTLPWGLQVKPTADANLCISTIWVQVMLGGIFYITFGGELQ